MTYLAAERIQVKSFFDESEVSERPVVSLSLCNGRVTFVWWSHCISECTQSTHLEYEIFAVELESYPIVTYIYDKCFVTPFHYRPLKTLQYKAIPAYPSLSWLSSPLSLLGLGYDSLFYLRVQCECLFLIVIKYAYTAVIDHWADLWGDFSEW